MSRHPESYKPLSEAEIYDLAAFLESPLVPPTTMHISAVNGLLTSIIIGPRAIPPSLWMDYIWGQGQPRWQSQQQMEHITSLLVRHLNTIAMLLADEPPQYAPLTYTHEVDGKPKVIITEWCFGFLCGVKLDNAAWLPLADSPTQTFIALLRALLEPELPLHAQILSHLSEENRNHSHLISTCVLELHRFWLNRSPTKPLAPIGGAGTPLPIKIGRNDLCPCGSGEKYKHCCGKSAAPAAGPVSV
jgi:uncharacterized protein